MAKVCLLFVLLVGCAPALGPGAESASAEPRTERVRAAAPSVRARVARLSPPFAARVASRRVNPSDQALHTQPLAELTRE